MIPMDGQPTRQTLLRAWMMAHNVKCKDIELLLGCSSTTAWRYLKGETMPQKSHSLMVRAGFPEDLLPHPTGKRQPPPLDTPWICRVAGVQPQI